MEGIGFQWDGDGVFIQAEAIGAGQRIGADASVRERDEGDGMECPGKGRRGTRWHRRDVKNVRVWLQRCYLFSAALSKRPLAVSSDTGQVFYGSNGVNGSNGANGRCGVYGRDGRIWLIDRWLRWIEGIKLQQAGN